MGQEKNSTLSAPTTQDRVEPSLSTDATPNPSDSNADEPVKRSMPPLVPPPIPGAPRDSGSEALMPEMAPEAGLPGFGIAEEEPLDEVQTGPPDITTGPPTAEDTDMDGSPRRRVARRRPAGPSRNRIAANDDGPSIGGLIYALQQKPSNKPFKVAGIASVLWAAVGTAFAIVTMGADAPVMGIPDLLSRPTTFYTITAIVVPIAVLWLLALLAWRAEELRLRSSTMTEVAIRLAEPDRIAEQSVASLGQAVRRQVSFMNDAISRALGRAGELEAMVHNEVTLLERSYEENERKIRGLLQELQGERDSLVDTSNSVTGSLQRLGGEIPNLIEKLSDQQVKLAKVIESANLNLTTLETSLGSSIGSLESAIGGRTEELQGVLGNYTAALAGAMESRVGDMQNAFDEQLLAIDTSLGTRTEALQTVFEEYARALDAALANRADQLDHQLVERTRSLDDAFSERLRLFDESIVRSTSAIDTAVVERTQALTSALDTHARSFRETIGKQATDLDEALMHGINSVRRASENISRQSLKAMEGLANQSDMLKNISENLLGQISNVTGRFENQGQSILKAANALETANTKIDKTLQIRNAELTRTLEHLSGKADEFSNFVEDYSTSIEGTLSDADIRARSELERVRQHTSEESERTLEDLRARLSTVSNAVTSELGSITNRFTSTSDEMRLQAARAAAEIAAEQSRLREQMEHLPIAAQESSEGMRRALQDQIKALDQLSALTSRAAVQRDVSAPVGEPYRPAPAPAQKPADTRALSSLTSTIAQELGQRQRPPRQAPMPPHGRPVPDNREGWSLGDLLARASQDEEGAQQAHAAPAGRPAFNLDIENIAHALDPATASAVWSRVRTGQRGVMVRSIYNDMGRALFDDTNQRLRTDPQLLQAVNRYLADFERTVSESDMRDPSGRLTQAQLLSDAGRVYLFLAHASGRLG